MTEIVLLVVLVGLALVMGWWIGRRADGPRRLEQPADTAPRTDAERQLEQQAVADAVARALAPNLREFAGEFLRSERDELVKRADELITEARRLTRQDLEQGRDVIGAIAAPLREAVDKYRQESHRLERERLEQIGDVTSQYRQLTTAALELRSETARLANALRSPHARGHWGQLTLRRTAELTGMVAHCDFYEQETLTSDAGRIRPDMVVRLPEQRVIVIDSKVPLESFLAALDATNEDTRLAAMRAHAKRTREHVAELASKDYQAQFASVPAFVVAFIPNDSFLGAAVEQDPDLIEFALKKNVVIATPSTFFALLKAVEHGWRQQRAADDAQRILELGRELAERTAVFVSHVDNVGGGLRAVVKAYNESVGSLQSRVMPAARRLKELTGATRDLSSPDEIDVSPRSPAIPAKLDAPEIFPDEASTSDAPLKQAALLQPED